MLWWLEAQSLVLMPYQLQDFAGMVWNYNTVGLSLREPFAAILVFFPMYIGIFCLLSLMGKLKPN